MIQFQKHHFQILVRLIVLLNLLLQMELEAEAQLVAARSELMELQSQLELVELEKLRFLKQQESAKDIEALRGDVITRWKFYEQMANLDL